MTGQESNEEAQNHTEPQESALQDSSSSEAKPQDAGENPGESKPKKKSDLIPRLTTAAIGIPTLLWIFFGAPGWVFAIVVAAAVVISTWEYFSMTVGRENRPVQVFNCLVNLALAALVYLRSTPTQAPDGHELLLALTGAGLALFVAHLFTFRDITKVSLHAGSSLLSIVYCGLMPLMLALLFRDAGEEGGLWVVMAMTVVWGSDTGAYFAGRAFGKHKLAPRVSPKKTIEGALGGVVASVVAVLIFHFTIIDLALWQVFALAIPANILGQIGDLCESVIKRAHGVKDSGVIIYGHGGLLDRIDALLFAIPWFYLFHRYLY